MVQVIWLFILLMAHVASASNTTYYVTDTGSNSNACTAWGTACATLAGAIGKSTGSGNTFCIEQDTVHRWTTTATTNANGIQSAPNVIKGCNNGGPGVRPRLTHAALRTGWTNAGSNRWWATHTVRPGSGVFQDYDLEGQSAHGVTTGTPLNGWSAWHPNMAQWSYINGSSSVTCPTDLNVDHEYCFDEATHRIYLYSTSYPDTRYTSPGVEVINMLPGASNVGNMITIQHPWWEVRDLEIGPVANVHIVVGANGDNFVLDNLLLRHSRHRSPPGVPTDGYGTGTRQIQLVAGAGQTLQNGTISNIVIENCGRACFSYTSTGDNAVIRDITVTNMVTRYNFNHASHDFCHACTGSGTDRTGNIYRNILIEEGCSATATGGKTALVSLTWDRVLVRNIRSEASETRRYPNSECPNTAAVDNAFVLDTPGTWTISNSVFYNIEGAAIYANHANLTVNVSGSTFALNGFGVKNNQSNTTLTINNSLFYNNGPSGAAASGGFEIGSTATGGSAGVVFNGGDTATTQNMFYHHGSPNINYLGSSKTLTGWRALSQVTGDDSSTGDDPEFISAGLGNFNLQGTSPALHIGPGGRHLGALQTFDLTGCTIQANGTSILCTHAIDSTYSPMHACSGGTFSFSCATTGVQVGQTCVPSGSAQTLHGVASAFQQGETGCTVTYAAGALTDSAKIGTILNSTNYAESSTAMTNGSAATGGGSPTSLFTLANLVDHSGNFHINRPVQNLYDNCLSPDSCTSGNASITSFYVTHDLGVTPPTIATMLLNGDDTNAGSWWTESWTAEWSDTSSTGAWTPVFTAQACAVRQPACEQTINLAHRWWKVTVNGPASGTQAAELQALASGSGIPEPDAPVLTQTHYRCRRLETPGEAFTAAATIPNIFEDDPCPAYAGGALTLRIQLEGTVAPYPADSLVLFGCAGTCGTFSNWHKATADFGGKLFALAPDSTMTCGVDTSAVLTAAAGTFTPGFFHTVSCGNVPSRALDDQYTELVYTVAIAPAASLGQALQFRVQGEEETAFTYAATPTVTVGLPHGNR